MKQNTVPFFQIDHVTAWMMVSHIFIFPFIIANNLCKWNKKSWFPDSSKPIHIGKTFGERSMWGFLLWILTIVSITHIAVSKSTWTFVLNGGSLMIQSLLIKLWKEKLYWKKNISPTSMIFCSLSLHWPEPLLVVVEKVTSLQPQCL